MTTIKLHGQLRQFGKSYDLLVRTPAEAVKALCVQIPGFERFISNAKSRGLVFAVFRGKKNIGEGELNYQGQGDIIISPVICGSKRAGSLQTIIGAVLIVAGAVLSAFGGGAVGVPMMKMGAVLAVGGVVQMLSPQAGGGLVRVRRRKTPQAMHLAVPRTLQLQATQFRFAAVSAAGVARSSVRPFTPKTRCNNLLPVGPTAAPTTEWVIHSFYGELLDAKDHCPARVNRIAGRLFNLGSPN